MNPLKPIRIHLLIPPPFRAGLVVLILLLVGCTGPDNNAPETTNAEPTNASVIHAEVWLQVEGMTKVQGIT